MREEARVVIIGGGAMGVGLLYHLAPEYEAPGSTFEIQMLGVRRRATVLAEPAYDPTNKAIRA